MDTVDLFQIRFPRLTQEDAVKKILGRLARSETSGICFADMSTINLALQFPHFKKLLQERMIVLNDGAGLEWIAKLRGKPFPSNLNGTDLSPHFLSRAPQGTRVFLLGGLPNVSSKAREKLASKFSHINFVGDHEGYFDKSQEKMIIEKISQMKPQVVLVALGNPAQVELIDRYLDDPRFAGTIWMAVGGLLDFYGGGRVRAPKWMRDFRLEWLHIVYDQPYKLRRYFLGIPYFLWNSFWVGLKGRHDQLV